MTDFKEIISLFNELRLERNRKLAVSFFRGYLKGLIEREQEGGA